MINIGTKVRIKNGDGTLYTVSGNRMGVVFFDGRDMGEYEKDVQIVNHPSAVRPDIVEIPFLEDIPF